MKIILFITCSLILGITAQELDGTIRKLRRDLLKGYDKQARPVFEHKNTTTVEIGMSPLQIAQLDEAKSVFTVDCWLHMRWHDQHIKWNPDEYDGISIMHFADHEVWQPDITLYNAVGSSIDALEKTLLLASPTGLMTWVPPATIQANCKLDYENYPQDIQKCQAKFGSWTRDGNSIDLKLKTVEKSDFQNSNPYWTLLKFEGDRETTYYACCPEPYVSLTYILTIQRRGSVADRPCRLLRTTGHILLLCMFWFPADSYYKFIPGLFGIISHVVALCITAWVVIAPAAADVAFSPLTLEFSAGLAAIIIEVIIFNITRISEFEVPAFMNFASMNVCRKLFCLCIKPAAKYNRVEAATENMDEVRLHIANEPVESKKGWFAIATICDRVAFLIFIVVFISVGSYI